MRKEFSKFRKTKNIDRAGVNLFMKEIKKRVNEYGTLTISYSNDEKTESSIFEAIKQVDGNMLYIDTDEAELISPKGKILDMLTDNNVVGITIINHTNQKIKDNDIKEIWGYRVLKSNKKTRLEKIKVDDMLEYCTKNFYTGEKIMPQEEIIYCGPDGKKCGFDLID